MKRGLTCCNSYFKTLPLAAGLRIDCRVGSGRPGIGVFQGAHGERTVARTVVGVEVGRGNQMLDLVFCLCVFVCLFFVFGHIVWRAGS